MAPVTVNDTFTVPAWTTVTFIRPFATTPLVFALPTTQGGDPSTLRIRNVTRTGFEIVQVEPSGNDGPHLAMDTAYLAIEPGDHQFPDGTRIVAFEHSTTSFANRLISTTWDRVTFPSSLGGSSRVVLGSIQTMNNESLTPPSTPSAPFMDVGLERINAAAVYVTLERAESTAGSVTVPERIGLLGIQRNSSISFVDTLGNPVLLQWMRTPQNIQGYSDGCFTNNYASTFASTPLSVASANTRDGNNGGWMRRCGESSTGIGLTLDEDIDNDSERNHIAEAASVVAASIAFHVNFDVAITVAKTMQTISDPINGTTNQKSIPEATVGYTISVENRGASSPDNDSLVVTDDVPPEISLCVTSACLSGGPIIFDATGSPTPPGVSLGLVEYSDDGGTSYSYTPVPDANGFDPVVSALRITMTGTFEVIDVAGAPSFELRMAGQVQ